MKRALLISFAMLAFASMAFAQAGFIGAYTDVSGTTCSHTEVPNGFVPIYVIHMDTPGAGAAQLGLEASNPAGFVHLGETSPYATTIGSVWVHDENQGGSIAYGSCIGGPNLIKTINLLTPGINPPCTTLSIVPDPASLTGTIEIVDCSNNKLIGAGNTVIVDPDGSCPPDPNCEPVPVAESNWGRVKALYHN